MRNLLLLLALLALLGCGKKENSTSKVETSDAVTAASESNNDWLPEPGESYEIIGYVDGIKGAIIRYDDDLYRGGDILTDEGALMLKKRGIASVISATPNETIAALCEAYNMEHIPFGFDYQGLTEASVKEFITAVQDAPKPVYIHCHGGKQRAGNLCMIYRGVIDQWDFDKSMNEYTALGGKPEDDRKMMEMAFRIIQGE